MERQSEAEVAGLSDAAFLVALDPSLQHHEYGIEAGRATIGREAASCDVVIFGHTVSRKHCVVEQEAPGRYRLRDLESTNGVFVNGVRVQEHRTLEAGDVIGLGAADAGHFRFQLGDERDQSVTSVLDAANRWSVGRGPDNQIGLPYDSMVSAHHATVRKRGARLEVVDEKSLNGTWVNGARIRRRAVEPTDSVVIGSTLFQFELLPDERLQVRRRDMGSRFEIECIGLRREVTNGLWNRSGKRILDDVCLSVRPGEFVGLLGPSGAGKSTLLTTMNGYEPPSRGCVLVNQSPLYPSFDMFRSAIGYVPQDDIIHSELSLEDSLNYIALLRLPADVSRDQRRDLVDTTIESLRLSHVRSNRIDQLSGGQRKRVSIGAELITRPSLLFLDEPTSGMDPSTEERLMHRFKEIAAHGTTVLITTHILYNLGLLDRIVILAQSRLVFFGTPAEAMSFFSLDDEPLDRPTRIFDLLEGEDEAAANAAGVTSDRDARIQIASYYEDRYRRSPLFEKHVLNRYSKVAEDIYKVNDDKERVATSHDVEKVERYRKLLDNPARKTGRRLSLDILNPRKIRVLARRVIDIKLVSLQRAAFYLSVPIVLALVTLSLHAGMFASDEIVLNERNAIEQQISGGPPQLAPALKRLLSPEGAKDIRSATDIVYALKFEGVANLPISMSVLLMFVMTAVFTGTLMACMDVSSERPIYIRERRAGLNIGDYLVSKLPFLFSLTAVQCLIFLALCFIKPELRQIDFLPTYAALVGMAWTSCAIGLFLSTLDPTPGQFSVVLAIVVVLPQLVLSGGLGPEFYSGMSSLMQGISWILPARWGLEMLMTGFFDHPEVLALEWLPGFVQETVGFEFGPRVVVINLWILLLLTVAWLTASAVVLSRKD